MLHLSIYVKQSNEAQEYSLANDNQIRDRKISAKKRSTESLHNDIVVVFDGQVIE